jgi:hypothetical protein
VATICPPLKIGQVIDGPMDHSLLPLLKKSLAARLSKPAAPISENFERNDRVQAWIDLTDAS